MNMITTLLAVLLGAALPCAAQSITLEWDAVLLNTDGSAIADLAGYRLFRATRSMLSMTTAQAMTDGTIVKTDFPGTGTSATVSNLSGGSTYYFRLTAYNAMGLQSGFNISNAGADAEFSEFVPAGAPPPPPPPAPPGSYTLSAPASALPGASIVISWSAPSTHSAQDWIAIYAQGASNQAFTSWSYVPAGANGLMTLAVPAAAGTYEARYLPNNGYVAVARSGPIAVGSAPPPPPPPAPVPPPPPPSGAAYTIGKTALAIAVDGDFGEFASAPAISLAGAGGNTLQVKMLYDDQKLYVAALISDTQLNAMLTTRDSSVFTEDDFELVLDVLNDGGSAFQPDDVKIMINPLGAVHDSKGGAGSWNGTFASAVKTLGSIGNNADVDSSWSAELAIPFSDLGLTPADGKIIGINLMNADHDSSGMSAMIWNGAINSPNDAQDVVFGPPSSPPAAVTDLNGDGATDIADVQLAVNQALGIAPCTNGNVDGNAGCSVTDIQRIINVVLGV